MRTYLPQLQIATLAPAQDRLRSKLGGVPWGMPAGRWPRCCGKPMKLLAQLVHEPPILDLGAPGAVLHLFQCLECLGIGPEDNEGVAYILDAAEMGDGPVTVPSYDDKPEFGEPLIGEFFIVGWEEVDDGIPAERMPEFYDRDAYWALEEIFPHIDWLDHVTRFGGAPRWTGHGPSSIPPPPFEFVFQIDSNLCMPGPLPSADEVGCEIIHQKYENDRAEPLGHIAPAPGRRRKNAPWGILKWEGEDLIRPALTNFGSDGTLFAFIDRSRAPHVVKWFWQR